MFYTITNLQGSQTGVMLIAGLSSFTPLQTYKVLKPTVKLLNRRICFTPLQTYKVLKHRKKHTLPWVVLHHYKLTRFSNQPWVKLRKKNVLHHYKLTRFSNFEDTQHGKDQFYTITNLQGSQTIRICFFLEW